MLPTRTSVFVAMVRVVLTACLAGAALPGCATAPEPACHAELRSWVVLGRARHLYAVLDCPAPYEHLSGVVEFTSESLLPGSGSGSPHPRVARMTPGVRLRPALTLGRAAYPGDRHEASYTITPAQARALSRDGVFPDTYRLFGANSNAAVRAVFRDAGLTLPETITTNGGPASRFPGVNATIGTLTPWDP